MSWIDDFEQRVGLGADEPRIKTDKIREAIDGMPDIDPSIMSPELQEQLARAVESLEELRVVLDEYDAE